MPLYEYTCNACGKNFEILLARPSDAVQCSHCGSTHLKKLFSANSSMSGSPKNSFPGAGDNTCCGSAPGTGQCAGPGSCCGKA